VNPLPSRQRAVLEFIERSTKANGYAPTVREIADALGLRSTNGVTDHLVALERKGWISREHAKKSRTIRVLRSAKAEAA
jgi:repressor LexA